MLLFSFSIFSDRPVTKIENENINTKTLTAEVTHMGLWSSLLANNVDPDETPHYVMSDLGLHCLPMTLL